MDETKCCSKCLLTKLRSEFYTDNSRRDKCQSWCKSCDKKLKARRETNKQTEAYKRRLVDLAMRGITGSDY